VGGLRLGHAFVKKYQPNGAAIVDLLGTTTALAYARMQVIEQAVKATGGTNDKLASTRARAPSRPWSATSLQRQGEWATANVMAVQFKGSPASTSSRTPRPK
jgi:branched-chain amino acid transport system substrate-binding protein